MTKKPVLLKLQDQQPWTPGHREASSFQGPRLPCWTDLRHLQLPPTASHSPGPSLHLSVKGVMKEQRRTHPPMTWQVLHTTDGETEALRGRGIPGLVLLSLTRLQFSTLGHNVRPRLPRDTAIYSMLMSHYAALSVRGRQQGPSGFSRLAAPCCASPTAYHRAAPGLLRTVVGLGVCISIQHLSRGLPECQP